MNLVIDIGNSLIKIAFFNQRKAIAGVKRFKPGNYQEIREYLSGVNADQVIVSDVSGKAYELIENIGIKQLPLLLLDFMTPVPFDVTYQSPQTLGTDRLAAVAGAYALYAGNNVLVVNTGTCLTYELLSEDGEYTGGIISPGMEMRMKAMHYFTGKLPLLPIEEGPALIGTDTASCMQSGTVNATICEVEGIISRFEEMYKPLKVLVCGGYTSFLASQLKKEIFAHPNLVLEGLNEILLYNTQP